MAVLGVPEATGLSWHWLSGNGAGRQGAPEVKTEALGRGREG